MKIKRIFLFVFGLSIVAAAPLKAEWLIKTDRKATNMRGEPLVPPPVRKSPLRQAPAAATEDKAEAAQATTPLDRSERPLASLEKQTPLGPPDEELVIIQTEEGFIPSQIRLRSGSRYRVHVVNLNPAQKSVSFVLDRYSQFHGTFFGQKVSFDLAPSETGVFSFISPETAKKGKVVVLEPTNPVVKGRMPASVPSSKIEASLTAPKETLDALDLKGPNGRSR